MQFFCFSGFFVLFFRIVLKGECLYLWGFLWSMKFIEMYEIQNTLKKKRCRVRYEHLPVTNDEDTR